MDGLISDDQLIMESLKSQPHTCSVKEEVISLVEELKRQLEGMTRDAKLTVEVPGSTTDFLIGWLDSLQKTSESEQRNGEQLTNGEKHLLQISRLEEEKESLILQVSVLTDQVEAQGEKIRDLEFTKEEMQIKLEEAEQFLESEIIKTTNLLNEKLEMVTEMSYLKMALSNTSRTELTGCKENHETLLAEKVMEIEMLKDHIEVLLDEQESANRSHQPEGKPPLALKLQLREKASEVNHLKIEVETLTAACKEKDQQLQEVQQSLLKFKRIEDMLIKANQLKGSDGSPVVSLDGIDSSSVHSADLVTTTSSSSSPEPYAVTESQNRPVFAESYTQAVNNPVTPSLRALKRETPPASPSNRKKHGIRASFGKGLKKLRGHKSSSEPNLGMYSYVAYGVA
ncbi:Sterile alpha motif [Desmophyllum pertusum]|uniref:Sterile alpha motif n=1 Tax=Desmophyllum pertusum TaxID=174260 RepID=A0A9W9ZFA1_9CNID|nr:Sterile alpha motif [Desmophyllum pertusum]